MKAKQLLTTTQQFTCSSTAMNILLISTKVRHAF